MLLLSHRIWIQSLIASSSERHHPTRHMLRQLRRLHSPHLFRNLQLLEVHPPQLGGCRQFAQWRGTQRMEGNTEKKRRRRAANARLRDWAAREDQIAWVDDRHVEEAPRASGGVGSAKDDKRWNAWRRMQSDYSSRRNSDKGAQR